MNRSGSRCAGAGLALGLVLPACMVAQEDPHARTSPNATETGSLTVALVAETNGTTYRLRNAVFEATVRRRSRSNRRPIRTRPS